MIKPEFKLPSKEKYKDTYLDNLLHAINLGREGTKYKLVTYARLQKMLLKVGKSKKNWSRDIWIANVLDSKNPATYFWYLLKKKDSVL